MLSIVLRLSGMRCNMNYLAILWCRKVSSCFVAESVLCGIRRRIVAGESFVGQAHQPIAPDAHHLEIKSTDSSRRTTRRCTNTRRSVSLCTVLGRYSSPTHRYSTPDVHCRGFTRQACSTSRRTAVPPLSQAPTMFLQVGLLYANQSSISCLSWCFLSLPCFPGLRHVAYVPDPRKSSREWGAPASGSCL